MNRKADWTKKCHRHWMKNGIFWQNCYTSHSRCLIMESMCAIGSMQNILTPGKICKLDYHNFFVVDSIICAKSRRNVCQIYVKCLTIYLIIVQLNKNVHKFDFHFFSVKWMLSPIYLQMNYVIKYLDWNTQRSPHVNLDLNVGWDRLLVYVILHCFHKTLRGNWSLKTEACNSYFHSYHSSRINNFVTTIPHESLCLPSEETNYLKFQRKEQIKKNAVA